MMAGVDVYAEFRDQLRPLRHAEYDQLVERGCFDEERIELLDGAIVAMSPEGPEHYWVIQLLSRLLVRNLGDEWGVRVGNPWVAGECSEPQPDIAVVPHRNYRTEHPDQARLLIEVAHSSRRKDLGLKARVYAAAGLDEYWVFDLVDRAVVRHIEPGPEGYRTITRHGAGERRDVEDVVVDLSPLFTTS